MTPRRRPPTTLRELRQQAGLTQRQVSTALDTSQAQVSQWETGSRKPNILHVVALAKVLGCTLDEVAAAVLAGRQ